MNLNSLNAICIICGGHRASKLHKANAKKCAAAVKKIALQKLAIVTVRAIDLI